MEDSKIHRVEVGISQSGGLKTAIQKDLGIKGVEKVELIDVYTIECGAVNLTNQQLHHLGSELFSDPIVQKYSVDSPLVSSFNGIAIEIGFKPGVTDNVGKASANAIKDALNVQVLDVYSSRQYLIYGNLSVDDGEKIARDLLANKLIERWEIIDGKQYKGFKPYVPKVILTHTPEVKEIKILEASDEELIEISKKGLLALNLIEMKKIQEYFRSIKQKRIAKGLPENPTDIELECIAQTWSEHCKHKIFNAKIEYYENGKKEIIDSVFKTYIKKGTEKINKPFLVSVFKDNAGVISFNDTHNLVMKVETHNSPTALDPYGGALTGIVGCNRDPAGTGLGCKLIFNTDVFCFANPFYKGEIPPRLFHPKRVLLGVHKGIIDGGNQSGIPTVNGSIYFDDRFLGKPLVFCGTGGIAPKMVANRPSHEKAAKLNDLVVMVGGRIGADGIHGATFSSLEINENSPSTAVQIGAPIVQKIMLDFLLECRDLGLFNAITDNGAGGLSSSVGEMGEELGARLNLDKAPLKYPGLMPWEILLSEAQERMTVAVPPQNIEKFMQLAKLREVEATVLGEFDGSKTFQFYYQGKLIGEIDMDFLHHGVPQMNLIGIYNTPTGSEIDLKVPESNSYGKTLHKMLSRLNICSKEYFVRRYDHEVQGGSIIKPFTGVVNDGPSDAGILKPLYDKWEGVVISHGLCSRFSDIDPYYMVANAVDEAIRNAVAVGADPDYLAGLDNFCWAMGFGEEDEKKYTGMLVRANKALYDYCVGFGVPCISGKDSMRNDYRIGDIKVSVPPTLLFSIIGKIEDVRKACTMDVKNENDLVYILGITDFEMGGSEYFDEHGIRGITIPKVNIPEARQRYQKLHKAIIQGLIRSVHDLSDGGLAVAAAESAFAGGFGISLDLRKLPVTETLKQKMRDDYILYSETASRFIVTVAPDKKQEFETAMKDTIYAQIGIVKGTNLEIIGIEGTKIVDENIEELKKSWQQTFNW